jgi:hypothetical protein
VERRRDPRRSEGDDDEEGDQGEAEDRDRGLQQRHNDAVRFGADQTFQPSDLAQGYRLGDTEAPFGNGDLSHGQPSR